MASRSRQHHGYLSQHRQDRSPGQEEEEENQHRGVHQADAGATLPQEPQAQRPGDHLVGGAAGAGQGGGAGVVLQQEAEGEADDTS